MASQFKVLVAGINAPSRQQMTDVMKSIRIIKLLGVVSSGEELVNVYSTLQPDIIFIDVIMNEMSGFETARFIKEQNKNIKIVMCSSNFDREFLLTVLAMKLDGYLPGYGNRPVIEETIQMVMNNKSYFHYGIGHSRLKHLTAYQYLQLLPPVNKKYSMNDN